MKNVSRLFALNGILNNNNRLLHQQTRDKNSANYQNSKNTWKEKHPYKQIHPWKSVNEFSEFLVQNVIYNKDGLVAINKPYGIAARNRDDKDRKSRYLQESLNKISNEVNYTLTNSLPYIAKHLGYEKLTLVKAPERYMTGVTLLAADKSVEDAILSTEHRALTLKKLTKSYWIVTTRPCEETIGKKQLGLKLLKSPCKKFERPVFVDTWSKMDIKRQDVKMIDIEHKLLSNSKMNLSSLIEMKVTTRKYHAIRLFAATKLHSPVLGDNNHGSRIQNIMGTWMTVNPFLDSVSQPPILNEKLLKALNLSELMQNIIPVHIHLRQVELLHYLKRGKSLNIQAPLFPEFSWTFDTLGFELSNETESNNEVNEEERQFVQNC
ncbi:ribosomal large subunit pseudouridine synthase C-like isoform X2 [Leptopilina boulardi]|nr:ribosomal large subunit pseudouridine synthase C-like isoform X2 [Leptopilina boulardi]